MLEDVFNKLSAVFFLEGDRLEGHVRDVERQIQMHGYNANLMYELIQAQTRLEYFKSYILDVLDYIGKFT